MTAMYWVRWLGGAVVRWGELFGCSVTFRREFSLHTFAVNGVGSAVIGVIWALFSRMDAHVAWSAFLMTGVLGGFTTFSASLWRRCNWRSKAVDDCRALCCGKRVALRRSRGLGILSVRAFS